MLEFQAVGCLYSVLTKIRRKERKMGGGGGVERERMNERTIFFINEGKGISTILFFFISPRAKNKQTNKQIEQKIIINSKNHINY